MPDCIAAVEQAFIDHADNETIPPDVLGVHVSGGGFHIKTAGFTSSASRSGRFVAKINANFPANPGTRGLPTVQGILALFDATDGRIIAVMDSIEITSLRTAAATAVAAKHLAPNPKVVTIVGCGEQSRYQLRALACVRSIEAIEAVDLDAERVKRFADDIRRELGIDVKTLTGVEQASRDTNIWITCTTARRWMLGREHVRPGAFVAAVGADNPEKQEIEPQLLAENVVIVDILEQCATIGDLHHALSDGAMCRSDVRADLAGVVSGRSLGRSSADEIIIFDSTGTALEDIAAASLVYDRAVAAGAGSNVDLGSS
jgi:alanine dehydrogenase